MKAQHNHLELCRAVVSFDSSEETTVFCEPEKSGRSVEVRRLIASKIQKIYLESKGTKAHLTEIMSKEPGIIRFLKHQKKGNGTGAGA